LAPRLLACLFRNKSSTSGEEIQSVQVFSRKWEIFNKSRCALSSNLDGI